LEGRGRCGKDRIWHVRRACELLTSGDKVFETISEAAQVVVGVGVDCGTQLVSQGQDTQLLDASVIVVVIIGIMSRVTALTQIAETGRPCFALRRHHRGCTGGRSNCDRHAAIGANRLPENSSDTHWRAGTGAPARPAPPLHPGYTSDVGPYWPNCRLWACWHARRVGPKGLWPNRLP